MPVMKRNKVTDHLKDVKTRSLTVKDIKNDYAYTVANKIVDDLLKQGLISEKEAKEIKQLNKQTFPPIYGDIID